MRRSSRNWRKSWRPVAKVAGTELAEQARRRLEQADICAKQNPHLNFSDQLTYAYRLIPWNPEKDVSVLDRRTEKDEMQAGKVHDLHEETRALVGTDIALSRIWKNWIHRLHQEAKSVTNS